MNQFIILTVFCISGASALIYELAWSRSFQIILGSTVFTSSALFSSFLLGFALGSYVFRNWADRSKRPLYAAMLAQWGIGLYSLFLIVLLAFISRHYTWVPASQFLRLGLCIVLVVPPAFLFGSLWPLINSYWIKDLQKLGSKAGILYSVNSVGAGLGAFTGGYLLIPLLGISFTCVLTAGLNLLAGTLFFIVQKKTVRKKASPGTNIKTDKKKTSPLRRR